MTKNESVMDRWIRLVLSIVFFVIALYWVTGVWQIIFYILAAILLITSATGFCLLYKLFGMSTLKKPTDTIEQ